MSAQKLRLPDKRFFLLGGAGFIGSHVAERLLWDPAVEKVTVFDNFSSGRDWHLEKVKADPRLKITRGDAKNLRDLLGAIPGHEVVFHFASNPDISKAMKDPDIDFREGTVLTNHVLEAMRLTEGPSKIIYTSGSGVYGEVTLDHPILEDYGNKHPISTYGASKLAGEALISSYCSMFGMRGVVFRFANVVGPRQTHGVGFDFVRKLRSDPRKLSILGDGTQFKSYIYVSDVIEAVLTAYCRQEKAFDVYNVSSDDNISVTEIAQLVLGLMKIDPSLIQFEYTGSDRGWKGDVPKIRLDDRKIRSFGWAPRYNSAQAISLAVQAMLNDLEEGRE